MTVLGREVIRLIMVSLTSQSMALVEVIVLILENLIMVNSI